MFGFERTLGRGVRSALPMEPHMFDLKGYETSCWRGRRSPWRWHWLLCCWRCCWACWGALWPSFQVGARHRSPIPPSFAASGSGADDAAVLRRPGADQRDLQLGQQAYNNYLLESNPSQGGSPCCRLHRHQPVCGRVATIGFIFGAYMTETFRGIPGGGQGELEAARAPGMRATQVFVRILFPR